MLSLFGLAIRGLAWLGLLLAIWQTGLAAAQDPQPRSANPVADALSTIFAAGQPAEQRAMGLQRSFVEYVRSSQPRLEIALVIDGTESMTDAMSGVRAAAARMMQELEQWKEPGAVRLQVVVYRDVGGKSEIISLPLADFTTDRKQVQQVLEELQPDTGAPYFCEAIDRGVHTALTKLQWTPGDETTRWLMIFADAPPYAEGFEEKFDTLPTAAGRLHSTQTLIDLAASQNIVVHAFVCPSREAERPAFEQAKPETLRFLEELSKLSGGAVMDLSSDAIQAVLAEAAKRPQIPQQRIRPITEEEINAVRQAANQASTPAAPNRRIRLAVLPHLPLDAMQFVSTLPAVRIADDLRSKLKRIPRADVSYMQDVIDAYDRAFLPALSPSQQLLRLGRELQVDYLVWGEYRVLGEATVAVDSRLYAADSGKEVVSSSVSLPLQQENTAAGELAVQLVSRAAALGDRQWVTLAELRGSPMQTEVLTVSATAASHNDLLQGRRALEDALRYFAGDPRGQGKLEEAVGFLEKVTDRDANAYAYWLSAKSHANLAAIYYQQGDEPSAEQQMGLCRRLLLRSYNLRDSITQEGEKREVVALHELLVARRFENAIRVYEEILSQQPAQMESVRQAHWMLAGIRAGDWGVPEEQADLEASRKHLLQILALFPDSSEARWAFDNLVNRPGRDALSHVPLWNQALAKLGAPSGSP